MSTVEHITILLQRRGYTDLRSEGNTVCGKRGSCTITVVNVDGRTGKADVTKLFASVQTDKLIVVSHKHSIKSVLCQRQQGREVEFLTPDDIIPYRLDHVDVPTYSVVLERDVAVLEQRYGSRKHFPKMKLSDPVAVYLGLVSGMVLKATLDGMVPEYRIVE